MATATLSLGRAQAASGHTTRTGQKDTAYWLDQTTKKAGDVANLYCKPVYHATGWWKIYSGSLTKSVESLGQATKDVKNGISATQTFKKLHTVFCSIGELFSSDSMDKAKSAFKKVVVDTASLTNSVCDGLDLGIGRGFVTAAASTVSGVNGTALMIGSVNGMYEEGAKMADSSTKIAEMSRTRRRLSERNVEKIEHEGHKMGLAQLNFIKWVSYFVLSKLILASWLAGMVAPPWAFLAASTSALVCTNGAFFYGRAHNLET